MKKLILTILTTITILGANAQGNNLQFNRALFETICTTTAYLTDYHNITNAFTIPVGKVWKINNLEGSDFKNLSGSPENANDIAKVYLSRAGQDNYMEIILGSFNSPLWLPEGSYDISLVCNSSNKDYNLIFSGIEFNIVQ